MANSFQELEKELIKELNKAIKKTKREAKAIMKEEISEFYDYKNPHQYVRTGKLKNTPKTSPTTVKEKIVSFEAYLSQKGKYKTGKKPTMTDVLNLTNYRTHDSSVGYLRSAVGRSGYWERMEKQINKSLKKNILQAFY